ncbi:uncharacterized protein GIQ15_06116 [Arthroderma uncinatum]|uniref:uncharacterized protein n=1 Tax=Arthroderma uncinatum TaxID=74035 RepID=UPI00144ADE70|nr:uncharacterized protein GIQ15_06116 [Arthroderma uncinatum]KAF3480769.1 hypothetical protein GIQ15_06116 [Arthroderma uncinatum]
MATLKFVNSVWANFRAISGLEPRLLDNVRWPHSLLRATPCDLSFVSRRMLVGSGFISRDPESTDPIFDGTVKFELDVQKEHTNRLGILHGGTIASMVDIGGSLAVASHGLFATGVSTDLNVYGVPVTYLGSGGKVGDRILAEVTCDKSNLKRALWRFY